MIRAIAVAKPTSDIVGTVDLKCTTHGLAITFVQVSTFSVSYIPGLPTMGRNIVVPYETIREVWDDGETLRVAIEDPRLPFRKLALTHFTRDFRVDHHWLYVRRTGARLLILAGVSGAVGGTMALAQRWAALTPFLATWLTFGLVGSAWWLVNNVGRQMLFGGEDTQRHRRDFFDELRMHLLPQFVTDSAPAAQRFPSTSRPLPPAPARVPVPVPVLAEPAPESEEPTRFRELKPTLIAIGASAFTGLLVIVAGNYLLSAPAPKPNVEWENPAQNLPATAVVADSAPHPTSSAQIVKEEVPLEACVCQTPSSPVLPNVVPRLTFLPRITRRTGSARRPTMRVEVATINNTDDSIKNIAGAVQFLLPGPKGPNTRRSTIRPFFYEGPLASAAAIKWRVRGRGTGFSVDVDEDQIRPADEIAKADEFAKLLKAKTRSVRLYGAAMLTRMRDPRAPKVVAQLRESMNHSEAGYLAALSRASAPIFTCETQVGLPTHGKAWVSSCIMNTSSLPSEAISAHLMVSDDPAPTPVSTGESPPPLLHSKLRGNIHVPAKSGVRIRTKVDVTPVIGRKVNSEVVLSGPGFDEE
jgi:hypothetical protein